MSLRQTLLDAPADQVMFLSESQDAITAAMIRSAAARLLNFFRAPEAACESYFFGTGLCSGVVVRTFFFGHSTVFLQFLEGLPSN